jgi:Neuraminidase (sialidase)
MKSSESNVIENANNETIPVTQKETNQSVFKFDTTESDIKPINVNLWFSNKSYTKCCI